MLVLSRKIGEQITIGEGVTVTVCAVDGPKVRIGIEAARSVRVLRSELAPTAARETESDEPRAV